MIVLLVRSKHLYKKIGGNISIVSFLISCAVVIVVLQVFIGLLKIAQSSIRKTLKIVRFVNKFLQILVINVILYELLALRNYLNDQFIYLRAVELGSLSFKWPNNINKISHILNLPLFAWSRSKFLSSP